jgi:hypothetical protein
VFWAPLRARVRPGPAVILEFAGLSFVPGVVVNDSQRFNPLADPLILSLNLGHLPAGVRHQHSLDKVA